MSFEPDFIECPLTNPILQPESSVPDYLLFWIFFDAA